MKHGLAIIGYGGMGSWHHTEIKNLVPEIQVVGAYDVTPEIQHKIESRGITAYQSLEQLLSDTAVEIVTVATPNNFHKSISIACLKAGKHVVCEKPVCCSSSDLLEVMETAKKAGKLFTVHQNRRWDKDFLIVKKILDENLLGRPYFIESRVQGARRVLHGWRGHKENGGGMLFDWGVHLIDQLMWMIPGKVTQVDAHLVSTYAKEVDDNIKIMIGFEGDLSAIVEVAVNCMIPEPRWHVSCMEGTAVIENWECSGKMVRLVDDKEPAWEEEIVYTAAGPTRSMAPLPREATQEIPLPQVNADWSDFYRNVVSALEGKAALAVKPEETLRVLRVIECIFRSAQNGVGIRCDL